MRYAQQASSPCRASHIRVNARETNSVCSVLKFCMCSFPCVQFGLQLVTITLSRAVIDPYCHFFKLEGKSLKMLLSLSAHQICIFLQEGHTEPECRGFPISPRFPSWLWLPHDGIDWNTLKLQSKGMKHVQLTIYYCFYFLVRMFVCDFVSLASQASLTQMPVF